MEAVLSLLMIQTTCQHPGKATAGYGQRIVLDREDGRGQGKAEYICEGFIGQARQPIR